MKKTFPVAISLHFLHDCIYFADCGTLGATEDACNVIDTCVLNDAGDTCTGKYVFSMIRYSGYTMTKMLFN